MTSKGNGNEDKRGDRNSLVRFEQYGILCFNDYGQIMFKNLRIVRGQAKILVVVTFERHLAYLRTMKLA